MATTSEVRRAWERWVDDDEMGDPGAEFDSWFAAERAKAWDEGNEAGEMRNWLNPYRVEVTR